MTVVIARYGKWTTYTGTMAEVVAALNLANARPGKTWIIFNGTNITGITVN